MESNGRDTQGRFSTGNRFGPGRPAYSNKQEYLSVTEGVVSPDRWRKIVERAANDAENGTGREAASAREFLAKYILPLPQKLDINVTGSIDRTVTAEERRAELQERIRRIEAGEPDPAIEDAELPDGTVVEKAPELPETGTANPA